MISSAPLLSARGCSISWSCSWLSWRSRFHRTLQPMRSQRCRRPTAASKLRRTNLHAAVQRGGRFPRTCRVNASSIRRRQFAHAAAARTSASWARMRPRAWNACRHSGRSSCMCARSSPAVNAIRSSRLRRRRIRFRVAVPGRICWRRSCSANTGRINHSTARATSTPMKALISTSRPWPTGLVLRRQR